MQQIKLFKSSRFLPLFITQFFGAFNDNAFKNSLLIWLTYDVSTKVTLDPAIMLSVAAGLFILPFFLFSSIAGQLADKYEKSKLVQRIKQIEIMLMIVCAIGYHNQNIYLLLIILFFMGVQSTFFGPLKYSLLPIHLKENELVAGNGFIEGGTFLSILLGTIIGGVVIRSSYGIELISATLILLSICGWLASRYIPEAPVSDRDPKINWNIILETYQMIGYAQKEYTVWLSIIGISWFWFIGSSFLTQFPTYTKVMLGGNEQIVILFLATFSIGIAIGSITCSKLLRDKIDGKLVPFGCLGITLSIILFCIFSNLYHDHIKSNALINVTQFLSSSIYSSLILASLLLLAVSSGIYIVPLYAIMQHRSNKKYLSRIIASNNILNALFMVIGSIIMALLFSFSFNINQIFLVIGIANIVVYFTIRKIVKQRLQNA